MMQPPGSGSGPKVRTLPYTYVQVGRNDLIELFPEFLVVGPQRTGTTWLYHNMRAHPEIFMPATKEIYFFNLLTNPEHPKYQSSQLSWYLSHFRLARAWRLQRRVFNLARWGKAYIVRKRGEATASYAAMEPEVIEEIARLRPDTKVVIMVRNPITRAWSHAAKDLLRRSGRPLEAVSYREWLEYFTDPYQLCCGKYSRIIDNWHRAFDESQVFLGRFEDIERGPRELLTSLYRFLDVDPEPIDMATAMRHFNEGKFPAIPKRLRSVLEGLFEGELVELEARYGWTYTT